MHSNSHSVGLTASQTTSKDAIGEYSYDYRIPDQMRYKDSLHSHFDLEPFPASPTATSTSVSKLLNGMLFDFELRLFRLGVKYSQGFLDSESIHRLGFRQGCYLACYEVITWKIVENEGQEGTQSRPSAGAGHLRSRHQSMSLWLCQRGGYYGMCVADRSVHFVLR